MKKKIPAKMIILMVITVLLICFSVLAIIVVVSIIDFYIGPLYTIIICLIILFLISDIR